MTTAEDPMSTDFISNAEIHRRMSRLSDWWTYHGLQTRPRYLGEKTPDYDGRFTQTLEVFYIHHTIFSFDLAGWNPSNQLVAPVELAGKVVIERGMLGSEGWRIGPSAFEALLGISSEEPHEISRMTRTFTEQVPLPFVVGFRHGHTPAIEHLQDVQKPNQWVFWLGVMQAVDNSLYCLPGGAMEINIGSGRFDHWWRLVSPEAFATFPFTPSTDVDHYYFVPPVPQLLSVSR